MSALELQRREGKKTNVVHPVMVIAQPSQIVGIVVRGFMIEMGKFLADRLAAQAATGIWICELSNSSRFRLIAFLLGHSSCP
ncbi:hypothetical protein XI09_17190 [Bradyrhizobium sp. CCBAU 11386]|nr:hypothetical protein [Bradyrhizobium sp. CCBAU 11386]